MSASDDRGWYDELQSRANAVDAALYERCVEECGRCSWCAIIGVPCEFLGESTPEIWRQLVHDQAAAALEFFGVANPYTRWRKVVVEMKRIREAEIVAMKPACALIARLLMAVSIWAKQPAEVRHPWGPDQAVLNEADARLGRQP